MKSINLLNFTTQLSALMGAGIPLFSALTLMQSTASGKDGQLISKLLNTLHTGASLSSALRHSNSYFDDVYCGLIEVGERTGNFQKVLEHLITYLTMKAQLQSKLRKALSYPFVVLLITTCIVIGMFTWIIPTFESVYLNANLTLPKATLFLVNVSNAISNYGVWFLSFISMILVLLIWLWAHSMHVQKMMDKLFLGAPVIGPLIRLSLISQWSMTMQMLLKSGLPLLESIRITARTTNHWILHDTNAIIFNALSKGLGLYVGCRVATQHYSLFTPMCLQLIKTGEQSGSLTQMIAYLHTHHQASLNHRIDLLMETLEPFLIAFLGIIIGGMVISLYLPLFQLGQLS